MTKDLVSVTTSVAVVAEPQRGSGRNDGASRPSSGARGEGSTSRLGASKTAETIRGFFYFAVDVVSSTVVGLAS